LLDGACSTESDAGGAGSTPNVRLGRPPPSEPLFARRTLMAIIVRLSVAWIIFGFIAAVMSFGPALLRMIAFGPVSLIYNFMA